MINATSDQPQATYTKAQTSGEGFKPQPAVGGVPPTPSASNPAAGGSNKKQKRTIFGVDARAFLTAAGLSAFLVLAMAAVVITRILQTRESVAPTLPQAAEETNCSLTFTVEGETPDNIICEKIAYQDEFSNQDGIYSFETEQTVFEPGDIVVFKLSIRNPNEQPIMVDIEDILASFSEHVTFLDHGCPGGTYDEATNTLSCTTQLPPAETLEIGFRVQINDDVESGTTITNSFTATSTDDDTNTDTCQVTVTVDTEPGTSPSPSPSVSPSPSPSPSGSASPSPSSSVSPSPSPSASPTPQCYEPCTPSNDNCPQNHSCSPTTNRCVYNPCLEAGVDCDNRQCEVTTTVVTTTPPVGCNNPCTTNADCANSNHVCFNNYCRLETNPNSTTCAEPTAAVNEIIEKTIVKGEQPVLPNELPETGILDSGIALFGAGAAAILAAGLLFLAL